MSAGAQALFPGIYFEVVEPPLRESLPRMDIAAFVGYAGAGPLHTPVAVEDVQRFRELFGSDLKLARDAEHNTVSNSCLGLAVDSFFRNGGRRCWVVRVADAELAQTAGFEIPGFVRTNGSSVKKCQALARSPGGWSRELTVNNALQVTRLPLVKLSGETPYLSVDANGWSAQLLADASALQAGDLLRVRPFAGTMLYLVAGTVAATTQGVAVTGTAGYLFLDPSAGSPPPLDSALQIPLGGEFEVVSDDAPVLFANADFDTLGISQNWFAETDSPGSELHALELLHFQWRVNGAHKRQWQLDDLGFCADHPRFWGALPSDELLFARRDGKANADVVADRMQLIEQASRPRFPLCAAFADSISSHEWIYLPVGVPPILDETLGTMADLSASANPLYLDGIENAGSRVFVDARLEGVGSDLLWQEARQIAYLSEDAAPLKGIHSLMTVEEATLIAVPDAIHRRWDNLVPPREQPLAAPLLQEIEAQPWPGEYLIRWSAVDDATEYRLQWSEGPDFDAVEMVLVQGDSLSVVAEPNDLVPAPATQYIQEFAHDCPRNYYFRIRAENRDQVSAWSNQMARSIPENDFVDCADIPLELLSIGLDREASLVLPEAAPADESGEGYRLRLGRFSPGSPMLTSLDDSLIERLEIQRAGEHSFLDAEQLFLGDREELELAADGSSELFVEASEDTTYYYRARGFARQATGPWSNTLTVDPLNLSRTLSQPPEDFSDSDILAVHRALLRLCYARGDLFGVLALPRHYRVQQAREHIAKLNPGVSGSADAAVFTADPLSAQVPPLRQGETRVMSHGALYFPWLASRTDNPASGSVAIRYVPPDGAATGMIAAKSIEQGAWIAAANSPINNVLALDTPISNAQWAELTASRINVIRDDFDGFLLLSADTLSWNPELSEISVRRLMSMLIRLTLREGNRYVFEPNNADLADRVQLHFESLFDRLYARGAFAGKSSAEAYRVVTDATINTRQSIQAGRFKVELQVAPSLPLKFIRIRLVQSGPNQLHVQEVS